MVWVAFDDVRYEKESLNRTAYTKNGWKTQKQLAVYTETAVSLRRNSWQFTQRQLAVYTAVSLRRNSWQFSTHRVPYCLARDYVFFGRAC